MSRIAPCLWFNGDAEAAATQYVALFPNSRIGAVSRYGEGAPFAAGTALMVEFELDGQRFQALNGGPMYKFTEAISLSIPCSTQAEIDHYWDGLLAGGGTPSQCGWLKDRFGLSWQVVPEALGRLMSGGDAAVTGRVVAAFMKMVKFDIAALEAAARGEGQ
jgi:predicted 3-demethylubiquinone-9 3-methyltransferase (glyoxalase superfamily)